MKLPLPVTNGHANALSEDGRKWSSREIFHILDERQFSDQDPILRVDVLAIKDRFAKFRNTKINDEPPKKQAKAAPIHAICSLTIWDSQLNTICEQSRKCEIFPRNRPDGERSASIELSNPFYVPLRHFNLSRRTTAAGENLFSTQLILMADNETDPWPPVNTRTPIPNNPRYMDGNVLVRPPSLAAKWHRLPHVPDTEEESLLDLIATQDDHKYRPKLALKIDAQWMESKSPLVIYNAQLKQEDVSDAAPARKTGGRDVPKTLVKTEWVFQGMTDFMQKVVFEGYTCPLCNERQFPDAGEYHFHLINSHDLFKFRFSQKFKTNNLGQSVAEGLVQLDVADLGRAAPSLRDFREMVWQRPKQPFDLEAYLKGDETWLNHRARRKDGLVVPHSSLERSSSREVAKPDVPVSAVTRRPDRIPNIVVSARKKFRVPAAPTGFRFYRTTAKCALNEGDLVSESDDNIDEEWLLEKHTDTIDSFTDTLPQEKEFMQIYDKHMLQEDVSSDLHAGEALVRFCRIHKVWLQRPDMRLEFSKKAAALKLQGALTSTIIRACFDILNSPHSDSNQDPDAMEIDTPTKNTITVANGDDNKENEPYHPLIPPEIGHTYGRCALCKVGITDMRKNIRCANPACKAPDTHLDCAAIQVRDPLWACEVCKSEGFKASPKSSRKLGTLANSVHLPGTPPGESSTMGAAAGRLESGGSSRLALRSRESSPSRNAPASRAASTFSTPTRGVATSHKKAKTTPVSPWAEPGRPSLNARPIYYKDCDKEAMRTRNPGFDTRIRKLSNARGSGMGIIVGWIEPDGEDSGSEAEAEAAVVEKGGVMSGVGEEKDTYHIEETFNGEKAFKKTAVEAATRPEEATAAAPQQAILAPDLDPMIGTDSPLTSLTTTTGTTHPASKSSTAPRTQPAPSQPAASVVESIVATEEDRVAASDSGNGLGLGLGLGLGVSTAEKGKNAEKHGGNEEESEMISEDETGSESEDVREAEDEEYVDVSEGEEEELVDE